MAISPDLLPITAVAVGPVGRRLRLAGQAMLTLALGLAVASGAAAIFALAQDWLDLIPSGFNIDATVLGSLTTVNDETIAVGLGEFGNVGGAFAVLGTNVAMLVVGASATLAVQRTLVRRTIARGPRSPVLRR